MLKSNTNLRRMMFKRRQIILGLLLLSGLPHSVSAADLADRLAGRILLQVESYGRAWYVDPVTKQRLYLQNGAEALRIMRQLGLGITNVDLARLAKDSKSANDLTLATRLSGRILLQVEEHGEAWYVDPVTLTRTYLPTGEAAYQLLRERGLGITTANLGSIPVSNWQVCADTAFGSVAYAVVSDSARVDGSHAETILPLASLTKLMTVLVANDLITDWSATTTVTAEHIAYPKQYVGHDTTSEIDLQVGDVISLNDILSAVLVASSNQGASVLADATGLTREQFIARMNAKAQELGLTKTVFTDVAGLDAHNVSTATEYARVAQAVFAIDRVAATSRLTSANIITTAGRVIPVINRNYSLLKYAPDAVKTGYLVEAQRNVAIQKKALTIVVLHARSMAERNGILDRYLAIPAP